jgi:hypothetical protein
MSLPRARLLGAFAVAIVATAGWFLATKKHATPESFTPPATTVRADAPAPSLETSIAVQQDSVASKPFAQRSTDERAAAVKHTLTSVMASERDEVAEMLIGQGLSRVDAERMGERFLKGYVDCLFDAVREQYEAHGASVNEFLDRAEQGWSHVLDAYDINQARWAMAACIANISQQTGISLPADYTSVGSPDEGAPPPPPWAAEMENRIRDHVASRPELGVTDVLVDCRQAGCNVMLVGRDIRIFDFDFDLFAEQNGFAHAVVRGERNRRLVWLER